jgi:hypothetical protein
MEIWPMSRASRSSGKREDESIVSHSQVTGAVLYLAASAAAAVPFGVDAPTWIRGVLAAALLAAFLVIARTTVRRFDRLDEFQKLIAWRAMALAGLVTVWVQLFLATLFSATGLQPLFAVIVVGPPQFWICTAVFLRQAERYYAGDGTRLPG